MSTKKHTGTEEELEFELLTPREYNVFILNDDYTPMEFVVDILMTIFHKTYQEAEAITVMVHKQNRGLCGTFSHEIAETKVLQVSKLAKEHGHPLKAEMEEA
jgi:ATP-dependent Clp protease adaptor protein ClpS